MIEKRLIFHFFIPSDYETNPAIGMHYRCLEKYHKVFDAAEFFISSTEESAKYTEDVKAKLFSIFKCKDIRIKEVENDEFYESRTFKEQVIDRIAGFNGLIFFGHTKGVGDVNRFIDNMENILMWVYGLYFYSLEFMDEVMNKLVRGQMGMASIMYGSFCQTLDEKWTKAIYSGTFFWINAKSLADDIENGVIKVPRMANRFFDEEFPLVYNFNGCWGKLSSWDNNYTRQIDMYRYDIAEVTKMIGNYDNFIEGYNDIREKIL